MDKEEKAAVARLNDWRSGLPQASCDKIAALIERQARELEEKEALKLPWQHPRFMFVAGLAIGALVMWLVTLGTG